MAIKPRFPGVFSTFVREHGYDRITLVVRDTKGEIVHDDRYTVHEGTGICAQALREFHAKQKSLGIDKCEVTFDKKVDIPPLEPDTHEYIDPDDYDLSEFLEEDLD